MRYAILAFVDSEDAPEGILDEIVSDLEFDHRTTVIAVQVLTEDGNLVAVYEPKDTT